ncbi:MAG: TolC family protein [Planctomycetota bacterium]
MKSSERGGSSRGVPSRFCAGLHRVGFAIALFNLLWVGVCDAQLSDESEPSPGLPVRVIAIVRDRDSEYFDGIVAGIRSELEALSEDRYRCEFRDDFNAKGNLARVPELVETALNAPDVDVVLAAGIRATSHAARMDVARRIRPVVGAAIEFADLDVSLLGAEGVSALDNFTFVRSPRRIPADLELLAQLAGTQRIHGLVERGIVESLGDQLRETVELLEARLGISIELVPTGDSVQATLAAIPEEARCVYVSNMDFGTDEDRRELYQGLAARQLPTVSIRGVLDVELGALAGLAPDNWSAVHRRMALNVHQILSGISTELLPVTLQVQDRLVINLEAAVEIGWSPSYDVVLSANFVGEEAIRTPGQRLALEDALARASEGNAQARAAQARQRAEALQVDVLRSSYRPQLGLGGEAAYLGFSDRIQRRLTPRSAQQVSFGVQVSQLLFSDQLMQQVAAQRESAEASREEWESIRLDAMEQAGLTFLQALSAEALYRIEKDNLRITENNLQLAKLRREIGAADPTEVYRWQSSQAQARALLIQRDTDRRNARIALNVALGVPRTMQWDLVDITLADDEFYFLEEYIRDAIQNRRQFEQYLMFVRRKAAERSPEIAGFERFLAAQGVLLTERRRRNFFPVVSLSAQADRVYEDGPGLNFEGQNEWAVGVGFSVPIFDGGRRKAEVRQIVSTQNELTAQRDNAIYLVEQRALAAGLGISASHPAMRLSRRSQRAAQQNFDAVQFKYSRGQASIVDLLDAQRQLLDQQRTAAVSVYQYLRDVVALQRSIAWFEFEQDEADREAWVSELREFMEAADRREGNER